MTAAAAALPPSYASATSTLLILFLEGIVQHILEHPRAQQHHRERRQTHIHERSRSTTASSAVSTPTVSGKRPMWCMTQSWSAKERERS
eukprot:3235656-Rhodomonas_salina.3